MVADYPIRLFLLALAAWSVAADVCAQSPVRVGYYDMSAGAGIPEAGARQSSALASRLLLSNVTAADLERPACPLCAEPQQRRTGLSI